MADGYFITPKDVQQINMFDGVHRRTMAVTDEAMLCHFFLEAGSQVPEHAHMNDQVGYLISGKLKMTIGDETRILQAGDSYAIPGGIVHQADVLEDSRLIDVFSPPRDDYRTEAR